MRPRRSLVLSFCAMEALSTTKKTVMSSTSAPEDTTLSASVSPGTVSPCTSSVGSICSTAVAGMPRPWLHSQEALSNWRRSKSPRYWLKASAKSVAARVVKKPSKVTTATAASTANETAAQ